MSNDFQLTVTMPGMPHIWDSTGLLVVKGDIIGALASLAVQQSPYTAPDDLTEAIHEFAWAWVQVAMDAADDDAIDFAITTDIPTFTCYETSTRVIEQLVLKAFEKCPAIQKWNEKRDPGASRGDPNFGFIDLDALARNISHDITVLRCYNDQHRDSGGA